MTTTFLIQADYAPMAINLPTLSQMTTAEFYEFCQANPELRIERSAAGEVIIMSPAFSDTGNRNFNLAVQLGMWAEKEGTGIGFDSSAGFTLPNGATRAPDIAWIKADRWNHLTDAEKNSFAPLCPDFVIELRSASDSLTTLQAKLQEYIENGASLGWLIDRKQRQVHIYRPNQAIEILENPEAVSGEPELPGFILNMAKVW
ncbi:MAG: Uma2 family endonuclease [Leptolyngbyaceae cyanobacterium CAN_BIN12]|nr:Uma2 family endonuclease [Leptolyngbyaceae cyanobacterium CAN_BIN12]